MLGAGGTWVAGVPFRRRSRFIVLGKKVLNAIAGPCLATSRNGRVNHTRGLGIRCSLAQW